MKPLLTAAMAWTAAAVLMSSAAATGEQSSGLAIGDAAPAFTMNDADGKEHTLSALAGKVVVLVCSSQECPWSRGADPDLSALAREYTDKGVVFLGIDSNYTTSPDKIRAYAAANRIAYPILKDQGNAYADALHATRTPEIFILDKNHRVVYHGAFDNRRVPEEKGETNYVKNALDSVLAGKEVDTNEVKAWGCGIKRAPKAKTVSGAAGTS